jgi:hypothetical protein
MRTRYHEFTRHIVLTALLAMALVAGGCASSGSNEEDEDENGNGGPETFTVRVQAKTDSHPFSGQGFDQGYVVDGEQGKELVLQRGETYEFQMENVPSVHPFYITTSATGQGQGEYSDGVQNNGASGTQTLTFNPSSSAPDTLYYNCVNHAFMGGLIRFSSSSSGGGGPDY